jgi:hypothetical protein
MANELNIALAKSGLTVTAQRYQAGAAVGSAISCPETGSTGFYSGNMTGTAGTYQVAFISAGANVGSGSIVWDGTAEVAPSTLTTGDLPSVPSAASVATAVRTELTEISNLDASVSSRLAADNYTAPTSAPTAAAVASAVRTKLTEISNLDASVSSRLASASYTAPANSDITAIKSKTDNLPASPAAVADIPTTAQIATAVEGSLLNEADGQAVLNALVGAIGNTNLSEVSLVAAVRADLERNGGKLDSIPTSSAPSASTVAGAVRTELATELGRLDASVSSRLSPSGTLATVTNLTNAPASVTPADIWDYNARTLTSASGPTAVEIRQEIDANSTKLDVAVGTRLAGSAYTAPANSDVAAIKAKTDALNTERLANVATTAIVGNLIAQANS